MDYNKKYNLNLKPGIDFSIKEEHRIPQKMGAEIFVFGKTMYFKSKMNQLPKHEYLHIAQFRKYGKILVIMHYLFFLTVNLIRYRDFGKAFKSVPFEKEARDFEEKSKNNQI